MSRDAHHPTAISPFPGCRDRRRRRDRDEGATGRGSAPKAGLTGFVVSNLHRPGTDEPWSARSTAHRSTYATPLDIMVDGPIGAAAFTTRSVDRGRRVSSGS